MALLAVTGESFVAEHAQAITSSALGLLPRLMPAPQALLRPLRPASLPSYTAKQMGVYSGVVLDSVGFFANIIHRLDQLPPFSFRVLEIRHTDSDLYDDGRTRPGDEKPADGATTGVAATGADTEAGSTAQPGLIRRRQTMREQFTTFLSNSPIVRNRPVVTARLYSPLHFLSLVSFLMSLGLIVAAVVWEDGTAVIAICLISFATSVICYASWWRPVIMARPRRTAVPRGDIIIRTNEGALLLIKCTQEVARELYSGVQECEYRVSGTKYRVLMTTGALMIMPSVILLGNCSFNMQVTMGSAYMILNVAYWTLGLLPLHYFWDLSQYQWVDVTPADAQNAHQSRWGHGPIKPDDVSSYTRTLWYAIRETRATGWVTRGGSVPITTEWRQWLEEARDAARREDRHWAAVQRKEDLIKLALHDEGDS